MPELFTNSNALAELSYGRNLGWTEQTSAISGIVAGSYEGATDLPNGSADPGVTLQALSGSYTQSPSARLTVAMREDVAKRTAYARISSFDNATTYTLTFHNVAGGGPFAINAAPSGTWADEDEALIELRDQILADANLGGGAGANQEITAVCLDSGGATTTGTAAGGNAAVIVKITGTVEGNWAIDPSTTGAGTLAVSADPSSASLRLFARPTTATSSSSVIADTLWVQFIDELLAATGLGINERGFTHQLCELGGLGALYAQVTTRTGPANDGADVTYDTVRVYIGVAARESP